MVTAGANQAFVNVAMTILDPDDVVVLVSPYYFTHLAVVQMANASPVISEFEEGTFQPNVRDVEKILQEHQNQGRPVKAVVVTTPNNPTGVIASAERMLELERLTAEFGAWLVVDETYEAFAFHDRDDGTDKQSMPESLPPSIAPHVMRIFSMSKSFGMPGWRVGYVLYPPRLEPVMTKIQDAVPTHASIFSQLLALEALRHGSTWVQDRVQELRACRQAMWRAVSDCGTVDAHGAFYFFVPLPEPWRSQEGEDLALQILAEEFRVLVR